MTTYSISTVEEIFSHNVKNLIANIQNAEATLVSRIGKIFSAVPVTLGSDNLIDGEVFILPSKAVSGVEGDYVLSSELLLLLNDEELQIVCDGIDGRMPTLKGIASAGSPSVQVPSEYMYTATMVEILCSAMEYMAAQDLSYLDMLKEKITPSTPYGDMTAEIYELAQAGVNPRTMFLWYDLEIDLAPLGGDYEGTTLTDVQIDPDHPGHIVGVEGSFDPELDKATATLAGQYVGDLGIIPNSVRDLSVESPKIAQLTIDSLNTTLEYLDTDTRIDHTSKLVHIWIHGSGSNNWGAHGLPGEGEIEPAYTRHYLMYLPVEMLEGLVDGDTLTVGKATLNINQSTCRYANVGSFPEILKRVS